MVVDVNEPPRKAPCPHCGNFTPHEVRGRVDYSVPTVKEGVLQHEFHWWAILECGTCGKLSLYEDRWHPAVERQIAHLAYPAPRQAPSEVPEAIRNAFNEAVSVASRSPGLAAVGLRRCLEGVCKDKGASGKTLGDQIRSLASQGVIPERLAE